MNKNEEVKMVKKKNNRRFMRLTYIMFSFSFLLTCNTPLKAKKYDIPSSIRFEELREESASPIVYYFSPPTVINKPYPILILCEGSSSKGDLGSVFFIREYFAERIQHLHVGYLTVEQWGIDGNHIYEEEFWNHYSRSQRLKDHLTVIKKLEKHPPEGWNGKFIFIGVSEGGHLVTELSTLCSKVLATVNWVGAGDWSWADELWQFFESWKQSSFWIRLYDSIPRWVPFSLDIPKTREEFDLLVQHIIENPSPNLWMGGMTYFYHADALQTHPVDYSKILSPFLVVKGAKDSDIASCDQFVQKALEARAPITYFRIDDMDHWIRKRPDIIDKSFDWLKLQILAEETSQ